LGLRPLKAVGADCSPDKIRDAINSMNLSMIEYDGNTHYLRSVIADLPNTILRTLKIKIPKPISSPKEF
jgi:hypothetical protein